ncbi:glycosyltransferase [Microbulbifer hainanensis]|uniref:glycosyltransferase n=1 Tax=Microbulbifer hainanensis TaxID=2735675 RepID=UPI0018677EBA|nr:glycosyltransferase [Microbulbifer hainanensis]
MPRVDIPTVIIPACNEETTILPLLAGLAEGIERHRFQVIVACNGCGDRTVELVRRHHPDVTCLDIPTPSKTNAINRAEALKPGFPRLYVDADIEIDSAAVLRLINLLRSRSTPTLVAPRAVPLTEKSSITVKWFYSAWQKTIFFRTQGFGSGVYGLNLSARQKFTEFPPIISDDGFVRTLGSDVAVLVAENALSRVQVPRGLRDLLAIKVRSKLGKRQLEQWVDGAVVKTTVLATQDNTQEKSRTSRQPIFLTPPSMPEFLTYIGINLMARVFAYWHAARIQRYRWQRDDSSRQQVH